MHLGPPQRGIKLSSSVVRSSPSYLLMFLPHTPAWCSALSSIPLALSYSVCLQPAWARINPRASHISVQAPTLVSSLGCRRKKLAQLEPAEETMEQNHELMNFPRCSPPQPFLGASNSVTLSPPRSYSSPSCSLREDGCFALPPGVGCSPVGPGQRDTTTTLMSQTRPK